MKRLLFVVASILIAGITNIASASERIAIKVTGNDVSIEKQQQPLILEKSISNFKESLQGHYSHSSHSSHSSHCSHSSHYSSR